MQMRSSDENSVCLSICLSFKCVECDKTEAKSVHIFIPHERSFSPVFWEEEWLVEGYPFYVKLLVNRPRWSKIDDFEQIFALSASAITPSEKTLVNTNRNSTMRFRMSLTWSLYVALKSPKGGS